MLDCAEFHYLMEKVEHALDDDNSDDSFLLYALNGCAS